MKVGLFVQARLSSQRLPGKMLTPLGGHPLLQWVLDAVQQVQDVDVLAVLTSEEKNDDPLAAFVEARSVECFRGSLENVAKRFRDAARFYEVDAFVRINGDSPLARPEIIQYALDLFKQSDVDLVTNVMPRSFPKGVSVEVIRTSSFENSFSAFTNPDDLEHVTHFYYNNPATFHIQNFAAPHDWGDIRFVIDTAEDLARIDSIVGQITVPPWEYNLQDLVAIYQVVNDA